MTSLPVISSMFIKGAVLDIESGALTSLSLPTLCCPTSSEGLSLFSVPGYFFCPCRLMLSPIKDENRNVGLCHRYRQAKTFCLQTHRRKQGAKRVSWLIITC